MWNSEPERGNNLELCLDKYLRVGARDPKIKIPRKKDVGQRWNNNISRDTEKNWSHGVCWFDFVFFGGVGEVKTKWNF